MKPNVLIYIYVDFGKNKNPFTDINSSDYIDFAKKENYVGFIRNFRIYGDRIFFSFWDHHKEDITSYYCFVSLTDIENPRIAQAQEIKQVKEIPVYPSPDIIGLSQNKVVLQLNPGVLNDDLIQRLNDSPEVEKTKYNNLTMDSNPILYIYTIKE